MSLSRFHLIKYFTISTSLTLACVCAGQDLVKEYVRLGNTVIATENTGVAHPISVNPTSGSAATQSFNFVARNAGGATQIQYVQFLFSKTGINALNACYVSYDPTANVFYLLSDDATQWYGLAAGSTGNTGNAQCTIFSSGGGSTASGTDLTVNVTVSFRTGFTGLKTTYLLAGDAHGYASEWQSVGTWNDSGNPNLVQFTSFTPNTGAGTPQTFTAVVSDGLGANTINLTEFVMNTNLSGINGCFISYDPVGNVFYLLNDAGSAWSGLIPGSATSVSNSQCALQGIGSNGSPSGSTLTIHFSLTFTGPFSGVKQVYMQAADSAGFIENWHPVGVWNP